MVQYFCPACFAEVDFGAPVCPVCGVDAAEWERHHDYTDRLIHALGHPVPTTRMMAILALKGRSDPETAMPLALCAQAFPVDAVQSLEIVRAIDGMPHEAPQRLGALRNLTTHESQLVRTAARRALGSG